MQIEIFLGWHFWKRWDRLNRILSPLKTRRITKVTSTLGSIIRRVWNIFSTKKSQIIHLRKSPWYESIRVIGLGWPLPIETPSSKGAKREAGSKWDSSRMGCWCRIQSIFARSRSSFRKWSRIQVIAFTKNSSELCRIFRELTQTYQTWFYSVFAGWFTNFKFL